MNGHPESEAISLYVDALNAVIDVHSKRILIAVRSRVPSIIWLALYLLTACAMGAIGYHAGLSGTTRTPAVLSLAIGFALILWLIADLDRPQQGLLRVDQHSMQSLRDSMSNAAEPAPD
jgi:hypothetical protein